MKSFPKKFKVLTQRFDVINAKLARKKVETGISCTNSDTKIKIRSEKKFQKQSSGGALGKR